MALDRNIYWIGRQWAVTGAGIQAVDQRLEGAFDIEIARLWDDDLESRMGAYVWLNSADFGKALELARARFPRRPKQALPLVESVLELIRSPGDRAAAAASGLEVPSSPPEPPAPVEAPPVAVPSLRIERASAKFLPQWRIRAPDSRA
jgi:hypothetical protein